MDVSPLSIELIRQEPKSDDCLRCCALMVFKYFGDKITKDQLWRKLHVYKKHSGLQGIYLSDLGKLSLKNGYKVTYFLYDWHSWDKETVSKSAKNNKSLFKTLGKLKSQKVSWVQKRLIQKEFNFAKSGGDFKFVIPSSNIIDKFLLNKIPVIVQVWAQDLYQDPKEDYRQAIIVTGKKDDKYLVKDPYLALEAISENELIHASIKNGGRVMVIEPSEKNVKLKQERLNF